MNEYRILLTKMAREDIVGIGDLVAYTLMEPGRTKEIGNGLQQAVFALKYFPYKYQLTKDNIIEKQSIRCLPYANFYIFFEVIEQEKIVVILRIGYYRKGWKKVLG